MNFKRYMFLTLMLLLTIFSISFVCASENTTYNQNTGELNTLSVSDSNPIDANLNNLNVNSVDQDKDYSLGKTYENEIETEDSVNNENETRLSRSSNDIEIENDGLEKISAENDLEILGASNDVEIDNGALLVLSAENDLEILGAYDGPTPDNPIAQVHFDTGYWYNGNYYGDRTVANILNQIQYRLPNGGVFYLDGQTYTGSSTQYWGSFNNIWIIGGNSFTDTARATFTNPGWEGSLAFHGTEINNCRFTRITQLGGRFFTVSEEYYNGQFGGSMSNSIFEYCSSYGQFYFVTGSQGNMQGQYYIDDATANGRPYPVTNVSFINCDHTYGVEPLEYEDGHGQFVAALGMAMDGCEFINCTSGQHSSAICINDESGWGPGYIASSVTNTKFINLTAKWFAVYIHGRYDGETGGGAPNHDHMIGIEVVENCTFINCVGTENYGGGLGISHDNVIVKGTTFINNTGGQGSAIMVGGIASDEDTIGRYAFRGDNTKGNNITIQDCTFENCVATVHDYHWHAEDGVEHYDISNGMGGAVFIVGNNTKVINCNFNNNTGTNGSAVYIFGINTTVTGTNFTNNSASTDGAVFIYGANTNITDSKFEDNTAINGAGVYVRGENTYIANTEFYNNIADPDSGLGGAIDVLGDHCTLITVTCNNNSANCGGAGFIRGNNTIVRNSTFDNNKATLRGGGLDVYGNNFNADDLEVSDNVAGTDGGAVYVVGNDATFTDVYSLNNTAARGGSSFILGDNIDVHNCTFDSNKALFNGTEGTGRGGALDIAGENCQVYDIEASDNYADHEGGAIYIKSDNLEIYGIDSENNKAELGGSTFIYGDNIIVHDCIFDGNNATLRGGGLNVYGDNCTVYNVDVSDNVAGTDGGAVYVLGDDATFYNVTSINNTASRGGSTFIEGDNANVHNCTLDGNRALSNGTEVSGRGGGLDIAGINCQVYDLDVSDNHADNEGGAIYIKSNDLYIYDIHSVNNSAQRGGSVYIEGDNITVADSVFNNNKAIWNGSNPDHSGIGGAIDIVGNDCQFINVTSVNNTAYRGGSTFVRGNNTVVKDCILDNNSATLRGGGINVAGDNCTVENVEVSNNKAGLMGGAIYVNSNGTTLTNVTADNNTAQRGGAAFINGTNIIIRDGELSNNKAIFDPSNPDYSGLGGAFDIVGDNILVDNINSNNNTAYRGGSSFIRGNNVTVQNCNLDNNSATVRGGALNIGGGEGCQILNVSVSNNNAGEDGGAVYVVGDKSLFDNVTSIHNTAERGGSSFIGGNEIIVKNCNLDNNSATDSGGGLYVTGDNCTFENVALSNCNATQDGGAVYVAGENSIFDHVTSIQNTAERGGSSFIEGNNITVRDCNLDNNTATTGGGLFVTGNDCTFENVALSNCEAEKEGGAVYVYGENSVFDNVTSIHNTADIGGSSYVEGNNITVRNCNLDNNTATNGGGLAVFGENCTFENVALSNCEASENGGAVYVEGNNNLFNNVTSVNNTAYNGGSSYILGDNNTVANCILDNNSAGFAGGGVYLEGNDGKFYNNSMSYNNAMLGGSVYIQGDLYESTSGVNSVFDNNEMSHNEAFYGGAIAIEWGENSTFTNNNITFNYASSAGGAVYVDGPNSNFTHNNISSNHAEDNGGGIFANEENLYLEDIYAYNNTAQNGGFAALLMADNLIVKNSTFISNHALGDIENDRGEGGAFHISGSLNATIQGDFYYNTAVNGSAIYLDKYGSAVSSLKVHDSRFFDNQAWSYLLIATGDTHGSVADCVGPCPCMGDENCANRSTRGPNRAASSNCTCDANCSCRYIMTIYEGENITIIVYHKGGDNIANGIYNDENCSIQVKNITYPFYNKTANVINKTTPDEYITPIMDPDYEEVYQYPFENNQIIQIVVYDENDNVIRNVTYDEINRTDIFGATRLLLSGLPTGYYNVEAFYEESTYYTAIQNTTRFRVIEPPLITKLTVNGSAILGDEVQFTVIVNNTLNDDTGNGTVLHNVTVTDIFNTAELEFIDYTNKDMWVINSTYYVTETVDGKTINYTCIVFKYQGDLAFLESANFTATFKTLMTGTLVNTVNMTSNETGNRTYTANNSTDVYRLLDKLTVNETVYLGENVDFVVVVTNPFNSTSGNFTNSTVLHNVTIYEIFKTSELQYISHTNSDKWLIDSISYFDQIVDGEAVNYTCMVLKYQDSLPVNESINFTITFKTLMTGILYNTVNLTTNETGNRTLTATNKTYVYKLLDKLTVNETVVLGQYVDFIVVVKNTFNNTEGNFTNSTVLHNVTIYEIFKTSELQYISHTNSDKWLIDSISTYNETVDGQNINYTRMVLKYQGNLSFDEVANFTITFKTLIAGTLVNTVNLTTNETNNITTNNKTNVTSTSLNVTKIWIDGGNASGTRPLNITVELLADGVKVNETVLNATNDWKHSFTDLPIYNGTSLINYTINEITVPNYIVNITKNANGTFVIENTLVTVVNVTKIWNDGNNANGTRPESIIVDLLADGVKINETTLTPNDWNGSFIDLPVYNGTQMINYTVRENTTLSNYAVNITREGNVFTIENTLLTDINVTKVWNDADNQDGVRPQNVTVQLLADGREINTTVLSEDNNWTYTFKDLPVYSDNGNEIIYTVNETEVASYTVNITGDNYNFLINNTHITENTTVNVTKIWNDVDNQDGVRPQNITVVLLADGEYYANCTLSDANNWKYTFDNLPVNKNNGTVIVYSIEELAVANYTVNITNLGNGSFLINNTHITENTTVNVTKIWNDADDHDGVRPQNITVVLLADGEYYANCTLSDANNWKYTFDNLPVNKNNGTKINYTVQELNVNNYTVNITGENGNFIINNTHEILVGLSINKTVDLPVVYVNDTVVFTINVTNNGPSIATNVTINDIVPSQFRVTDCSDAKYVDNELYVGTLNPGQSYAFTITAVALVNGTWTNIANATCAENDTVVEDNATVTVLVLPPPHKIVNETRPLYNQIVTYNLTVINDGDYDFTKNVTVYDMLPDGLEFIGRIGIYNATILVDTTVNSKNNISWVITDIPAHSIAVIEVQVRVHAIGNLTNNETIVYPDGTNMTVNSTVEVLPYVDVSVVKTVDKAVHFVDDVVVWTITVSNAGNGSNATNVTLKDVLPANFTLINYTASVGNYTDGVWSIGFMGNGSSVTLTINSRATAVGNYTNYANVTCNETEWNYANNFANATVTIYDIPDINKTANVTQTHIFKYIDYNLTITNTGNVSYNETLTIVDSLPYGLIYVDTVGITGARVVQEGTPDENLRVITWKIADIDPLISAVITVRVYAFDIGNLTNNATLIGPNGTEKKVNATVEVLPYVDVSVVKTVDKAVHFVDDVVVWTITVSNAGNGSNATNVTLKDVLPANFTLINYIASVGNYSDGIWSIGFMGNGSSVTLTINSRATAVGNYTNYANVTCNETEWNYANNFANASVKIYDIPDINKTANVTQTHISKLVDYNLTITNTGNISYNEILTIVDSLPYGLKYNSTVSITGARIVQNANVTGQVITWKIADIAPGASAVITVRVLAYDIGNLTNNATLIGPNGTEKKVNATVEVLPYVDVSVVKTVDNAEHFIGQVVVWTIRVSNAGNGSNATNVTLKDVLPANFTLINYTASVGDYTNGVWSIGFMGNGSSVTLTINSRATAVGNYINYANVTCNEDEWNYSNNFANATVKIYDIPDIDKTANETIIFINDSVLYYITITNVGNVEYADTLEVIDSLPNGLEYIETIGITGANIVENANVTGQVVTWKISNIQPGTPAVITVKAKANVLGDLTNNATEIDPYGNNKTVNCTVNVKPICDLEILKSVNATSVYINELVEWTITVINHGPSAAEDVVVTDTLPSGLKVKSATPSVGKFDENTGIWSIGDMENDTSVFLVLVTQVLKEGSITNIVVVETPTNETNYTNNEANNTTVVKPICDLEITKVVNNEQVYVGENVIWTIKIRNNGPSIAKNVKVTDLLPKGLKLLDAKVSEGSFNSKSYVWTINSLANGASATLKLTTKVVREGFITNPASVKTTTEETNYTNNDANDTTEGIPIVDLELKKYSDKEVYTKGEKMYWTIIVTNYGPSTAKDVVVSDVMPSGVKFLSFKASKGSYDSATGKWDIGELAKGETVTIVIYCKVIAEDGVITNNATVNCSIHDSNPDNNNDSASIKVVKTENPKRVYVPPKMHPTGNPFAMVVLSLLAIVGVTIRRKL